MMPMALFPIRRPTLGLHIGARAFTLAEVGRSWRQAGRGRQVRRCVRQALPDGVLRLSAAKPNVLQLPAAAGHLRDLAGTAAGRCVAVSLPDQCGRLALFEFESLPRNPAEVEALLRFRFQKDLAVSLGEVRLAYRVFTPPGGSGAPIRVLVGAVRQEILAQYEELCEQAGLIPVVAGLSGLQVFDAYAAAMSTSAPDLLFVHVTEDGLTFLAVRQGCPVFLRVKSWEPAAAQVEEQQAAGGTVDARQELVATVHYYAERYVAQPDGGKSRNCPLYVVKGYGARGDPLDDAARRLVAAALCDTLQVEIRMLDWHALRLTIRSGSTALPGSGLPALAALLAA
jgi:hypothetical protein